MSPARRHRGTPPDRRAHASIAPVGPAGYSGLAGSVTALSSGRSILARLGAVFAIDAAASIPGEQWALNQGTGGQVLRARYGSVGRAEVRNGALILPGNASNLADIADSAALDVTGDIDILVRVALDSWPPPLNSSLIAKWTGGGNLSYGLGILTSGTLLVYNTADGVTNVPRGPSSALPAIPSGEFRWLRATIDVDNGAGGNTAAYYWAPDSDTVPTAWTAIGTSTVAGTTSIIAGGSSLQIGASNLINAPAGLFKRCIVRNGIDGPAVLDANFAAARDLVPSFTGNHGIGIKSGALVLPGLPGVHASTPDAAALDITGDLDLRALVQLDDWTPSAALSCLIDKYLSFGNQRAYALTITDAGMLRLYWSPDGISGLTEQSTTPVPFADGATGWVRATLDVNNGAGGHQVRFYTSTDGVTWTEFGTPAPGGFVTSVFASTAAVAIGISTGGVSYPLRGKVHRAVVRNGIDGPAVLDVDFSGQTDNAASFTGNHGIGIKSGALVLPGLPGVYASVPHQAGHNVAGDLEVGFCATPVAWSGATIATVVNRWSSSWMLAMDPSRKPRFYWQESAVARNVMCDTVVPFTDGQTGWVKVALDVDNGSGFAITFYTSTDGTTWSVLGTPTVVAGPPTFIDSGNSPIGLGARAVGGSTELFAGRIHRAWFADGIGGPRVFDADFSGQPDDAQTFTCLTGQTVTVNGCARPTVNMIGCALPTVTITAANAVDTNDPLWCEWEGRNYAYSPGTAGNAIVVGHSGGPVASLGVFDFAIKVRLTQMGAVQYLAGTDSTNFTLLLSASNQLQLYCLDSTYTTPIGNAGTGAVPGLAVGEDIWLRARVTVSDAGCESWYSRDTTDDPDQVTWTQIGTRTIGTGAGLPPALPTTVSTMIGSHSAGIGGVAGRVYAFRSIYDGATRARVILTGPSIVATGSGLPNPVFYRSATGRKLAYVTRPVWLFAVDDYLEVADNALLDFAADEDLTLISVWRMHGAGGGFMAFMSKTNPDTYNTAGYLQGRNSGDRGTFFQAYLNDGAGHATTVAAQAYTDGQVSVFTSRRTGSTGSHARGTNTPNTMAGISASMANALPLRIGFNPTGSGMPIDGELLEAGIFRSALSDATIAAITAAFNAA